jgi:hypothetical protein
MVRKTNETKKLIKATEPIDFHNRPKGIGFQLPVMLSERLKCMAS